MPASSPRFCVIAVVFASVVAGLAGGVARAAISESRIRKVLVQRVDRERQAPGIVLGYVAGPKSGIVAHGRMGVDDVRPVQGDTLFEIGSVSKLLAGLLLAEMAERGDVGLGDPVASLVPELGDRPEAKAGHPITLLHLAQHRSGLPREPGNYELRERYAPDSVYGVSELLAFVATCPLESEPGKRVLYSNLGFGLLARALARGAGEDYEAALRSRVLDVLDMRDTAIHLTDDQRGRFATGHLPNRSPVRSYVLEGIAAAGAFKSTANDLLRFVRANLGSAPPALVSAIHRTQLGRRDFGVPNPDARLVWSVASLDGRDVHYHGGTTWGFNAFVAIDRSRDVGVVVLGNSQNDVSEIGWEVLGRRAKAE